MMPNPTPAPRPCTLWGSTFDANHVTSYGVRAVDDFDVFPASRMFQSRITLGDEQRLYAPFHHEMRIDAHRDMQEAITTIHNALHPPLCLKDFLKHYDELNQSHTPKKESLGKIYVVTDDNTMAPIVLFSHQLNSYYLAKSLLESGYQKVTILNLDGTFYPHGQAEAVVNAWKWE